MLRRHRWDEQQRQLSLSRRSLLRAQLGVSLPLACSLAGFPTSHSSQPRFKSLTTKSIIDQRVITAPHVNTRTCPNWGDLPKCRAGVCDCAALRNARAVRAKVGFFRKRFGSASASRVSFFARRAAAAPFWGGRSRKMAEAGPSRVPDRPRRVVQTKSEGDVIPQSRH